MKNKEKELLLKDLCGRLPYGVKVAKDNVIYPLTGIDIALGYVELAVSERISIEEAKPYLRSMSSMTEEEKKEVHYFVESHKLGNCSRSGAISDYLNSIHIDYRGLIEKGLALEAPEGMYN